MMKQIILLTSLCLTYGILYTQADSTKKERLDFAKTYFEYGGNLFPSFTGKNLNNNQVGEYKHPASVKQYLNWGGFHFWGHTEFYVSIPLRQINFGQGDAPSFELTHSVATGLRLLPWPYEEKKLRPYLGASWSALDFKQIERPEENQPLLSKDFLLAYDAGLLYGIDDFTLRIGLTYFPKHSWEYPLSKTRFERIKTPPISLQVGLLYAMDLSRKTGSDNIRKWNNYPRISSMSTSSGKSAYFFLGIGPSLSYSLKSSAYNQEILPYLKDKISSKNYFDISLGYHFHKAGLFTALSFRKPQFETEGYGAQQKISKASLALEVNKFLLDYTGFTPYLGINLAYEHIKYQERIEGLARNLNFKKTSEVGITFGWDIRPGKNDEALILRTNLRWYPFSSFEIDGKKFSFNQLEYNLIQLIFYPEKWKRRK